MVATQVLQGTRYFKLDGLRSLVSRIVDGREITKFERGVIYPTDDPNLADALAEHPNFKECDEAGAPLDAGPIGPDVSKARSYVGMNGAKKIDDEGLPADIAAQIARPQPKPAPAAKAPVRRKKVKSLQERLDAKPA